jgi:hypothetical protein
MSHFWIEGNQSPAERIDIRHELRRHARGHFWAEHRKIVLEVHGVDEGGWWCELREPRGTLPGDAIGPEHHGLVRSWDGGGEPFTIRRVCALPEDLAVTVIADFVRDGGRSEAVRWGHGVVRDSWGWVWRDAKSMKEYPEVQHLEQRRDGGLGFTFGAPLSPTHARGAVWDAITDLEVGYVGGLEFLAHHPIADLRALIVADDEVSLAPLQAVLDRHPALAALTIGADQAARLAQLRAPRLQRLHIALDPEVDADAAAQQTAKFAALTRTWQLPALCALRVDADVADDDDYVDDDDEDDE